MDEKLLIELMQSQTEVGKETVRELQKLNDVMRGVHTDTTALISYFKNGFKKEIVDGVAATREKLGDKLTRNTIALITLAGAVGTLTVFVINLMVY